MTNLQTLPGRRIRRLAVGALALGGAALLGAACTPPDPGPTFDPAVTFSATTDLAQVGSTVTVTGSGFDPSLITPAGTPPATAVAGIYVAIGIGDGPVPTAYTSAKYIRPTGPDPETGSGAKLQSDGTFTATIATPPLFAGQNQAVNCYLDACKVFVWSAHAGTVPSWSFSAPASFAPATAKQVVVSKTTGLNRDGETVTVTGAGFAATSPGIYVGQLPWSEENAPAGWNLDAAAWGATKYLPVSPGGLSTEGNFRTTIDTAAVIGSSATDCGLQACSIATVKAHGQSDPTGALTSWTPISFPEPPAPPAS